VDFRLELLVLVRAVEEGQVDDVSRVLERQRGLLVGGVAQVDAVHRDDLVAAANLGPML
jgi:hypothetical protein